MSGPARGRGPSATRKKGRTAERSRPSLTARIEKEHLQSGVHDSMTECPIALALNGAGNELEHAEVTEDEILVVLHGSPEVHPGAGREPVVYTNSDRAIGYRNSKGAWTPVC